MAPWYLVFYADSEVAEGSLRTSRTPVTDGPPTTAIPPLVGRSPSVCPARAIGI